MRLRPLSVRLYPPTVRVGLTDAPVYSPHIRKSLESFAYGMILSTDFYLRCDQSDGLTYWQARDVCESSQSKENMRVFILLPSKYFYSQILIVSKRKISLFSSLQREESLRAMRVWRNEQTLESFTLIRICRNDLCNKK